MEFKLIIKKIEKTLSEKESILFDKWYNESLEHRRYFHKVEKNYHQYPERIHKQGAWMNIEERLGMKGKQRNKNYWKYGIAASVLLLIAVFFVLNNHSKNGGAEDLANFGENVESTIEIGSNKAILTLEDGSDIALEKGNAINRENLSSNGEELVYLSDREGGMDTRDQVRYNTLTIPRGGEFFLQLSDGTKVWLNSDSRIRYPVAFTEGNLRKVELIYGEAYFDVSHAENHGGSTFKVLTGDQEIDVLGTEFNVKAYREEVDISSTLVEGSIKLVYGGQIQRLEPNDQAIVHTGTSEIEVRSIDVYNEIAWRKGVFGFEKETLAEIMKVLSRWYDVDVVFESDSIEDLRFTGALNKRQEIEHILTIISRFNDIDYEIKNQTVTIR